MIKESIIYRKENVHYLSIREIEMILKEEREVLFKRLSIFGAIGWAIMIFVGLMSR